MYFSSSLRNSSSGALKADFLGRRGPGCPARRVLVGPIQVRVCNDFVGCGAPTLYGHRSYVRR